MVNIISDLLSLLFILFMFFVSMKLYDYGNRSPLEKSYERKKMLDKVDNILDSKHSKLNTNNDYIKKLEVELDNEYKLLYQYRIELLEKQIEINKYNQAYRSQKDATRLYKKIESLYNRIIQIEIKKDNHYGLICRKDSLKENKKIYEKIDWFNENKNMGD